MRRNGFTLIEVLIAIALLSLMSIAIYQVTTRSFELNFKLGSESTDYVSIILSLQTVERDIAQIYNPTVGQTLPPDPSSQEGPSEFWSPQLRSDGMRRARLKGTKEKITFINNGNFRLEADAPQSDFQKVTWEIKSTKDNTYSLNRTTDWDAFRLENGSETPLVPTTLLENMSSAKFSYYRAEKNAWEDEWDSESPYAKPESRFPELISLKISVPDPTNSAKQQEWELVVKPNFPLNGLKRKRSERELLQQ